MKVWRLKISLGNEAPKGIAAMLAPVDYVPRISKEEFFVSESAARERQKQIEDAVATINLVPWLIDLKLDELTVHTTVSELSTLDQMEK